MKASDLFIKSLENEGVEYIFGLPGEENLDILQSLKSSKIRFVVCRHEQAAGFMAATYGRLSGRPGVCLSTLGPGATNLVTAAAYAQLGGMPMLMITGQKPINKSKQGFFQIVDTVEIMSPVTKMSRQVLNGSKIPSLVREAFRISQEERPGAVHLELPEDIAAKEVQDAHIFKPSKIRRPIAEGKSVDWAVDLIQKSERPLILIGAGANRKQAVSMIEAFIDKTGIPFFNTQMGKGVVSEKHPLFLGTAALSDGDYIHCAIEKADLIINIGHDVIEKPPFVMKNGGAKVIHVNFFGAGVDEVYFPQVEVIGDIGNAVWQIKEKITVQDHWDFSYYSKIKKEIDTHIVKKADSNSYPMLPQRIVQDVSDVMTEDGIVTLDNGMYKIWFARNYRALRPNSLLLDNALATMGAGLPSAISVHFIDPKKKIIAVCGDGGFMMNSQELETAVRLHMHLVILIINDNEYGMIRWKQQSMGFDRFGLHYKNPDFVQYAKSYGAHGYRVVKASDLKKLLKKCLTKKAVHLIEIPVDYRENIKVLTKELQRKVCKL